MKDSNLLRKGSRGDEVKDLQQKLTRLGFPLNADCIYRDDTEKAVISLQTLFGYSTDGIVGEGTKGLIDAQLGYGWNLNMPNAKEMALAAQGKGGAGKPAAGAEKQGAPAASNQNAGGAPAKGAPGGGKPAPSAPMKK
jgi:peptidoglycan hydrolase-like protein with peptidoglycan-binding domain